MKTSIDLHSHVLTITADGTLPVLSGPNETASQPPHSPQMVGLVLDERPFDGAPRTAFATFLSPSKARALASIILSAATDAREPR